MAPVVKPNKTSAKNSLDTVTSVSRPHERKEGMIDVESELFEKLRVREKN